MDSMVEVKLDYVKKACEESGIEIRCEFRTDPIDFAVITNKRGDMGSIGAEGQLFEPFEYCPSWSPYMKKWARDEGFSNDQIEKEDLMRKVSLEELVHQLAGEVAKN